MKLLLVEDDENLAKSLVEYLTREQFFVEHARSIAEAKTKTSTSIQIILLDWMLPDGQGIDYLKWLRAEKVTAPIIFLTARTDLIDRVLGLESGANDYITKPFEPRELLARIRVQMRSYEKKPSALQHLELGHFRLQLESREAFYKGELMDLTKKEYDLLCYFAVSPNRVFSREELLNAVWGYENYPTTRTVDTHILQLRQKSSDEYFETVRGVGYRFRIGENLTKG